MTTLETLEKLYRDYCEKAEQVRRKASRFAGAFNMGDDPRRHSCHEQFYEDVAHWTTGFLAEDPTAEQAEAAVRWILESAAAHRDEDVYWYMYAAQGHTKNLIPRMEARACAELAAWYDETYPVLDRMPAQQEVYRLLKKQAGKDRQNSGVKFSFFRRGK